MDENRTIASPGGGLDLCLRRIDRGIRFREALMTGQEGHSVPYAEPLLDAVELFEQLGLGYALAGGVAAMYYGRARFTEDIDFVAVSGHMEVLSQNADAMRRHSFDPSRVWKVYHKSGIEVDLWKDEHSDEIVARAATAVLAGRNVRIAEVHDLIAMKLRAGRLQDDYDVSEILRRSKVDDSVVRSLVDGEQFDRYQAIKQRSR